MSYLVFARKYRPLTFDEVVAQEHVTRTLRNTIKNDRIGTGYLFCGPRGTGKTSVARILARAINCEQGPTETPCGKCPACQEITSGNSLDVLEIDAASNTGVDDVRALRENVRYLPTHGRKRIYIIDEVHRLSGSAFDALLKTLEEPPSHVLFIFATTEPIKVPDTILSRTQRFDFRRVTVEDLSRHLKNIAEKEKITIDEPALHLLARKADGSVRDSLSLLDQITSFAGDTITEKDVITALGLVDRQFLMDYVETIAASDRKKILQMTSQLFESGVDIVDFVQELLEHFRILLVFGSNPEGTSVFNLSEAEIEDYRKQLDYFNPGDLLRLIKITSSIMFDIRSGLDERLVMEIAGVKLAELESTIKLQDILAHLQQGNVGAALPPDTGQSPAQPSFLPGEKKNDIRPAPAAPVDKTSSSPPPVYTRKINLPQLQAGWDDFLAHLRRRSAMLSSQLRMAEIRSIKENKIEAVFYAAGEASLQLVQKQDNLNLILSVLREHYKANLGITFEIDKTQEHPPTELDKEKVEKIDPSKLIERSPRLKMLIEKVDGEIIGLKRNDDNSKFQTKE